MSVNRFRPYVYVLPEDDKNSQLANGFHLEVLDSSTRQLQVLPEAGGWREVLSRFRSVHLRKMQQDPNGLMILLIDFDGAENRRDEVRAVIPGELADRVFVLGVWTQPERLTADLGRSCEEIGRALGRDCRDETETTWGHELLRHNAAEVNRLRQRVRAILF
jgi:hypothetical protein